MGRRPDLRNKGAKSRCVREIGSWESVEDVSRRESCRKSVQLFAYVMSRGMGKSTLMMILVLWAVLHDWARYIMITSGITLGHDFLQAIADELQDNEVFLSDFPKLKCFVALEGEPRKQGGQTVFCRNR